ncbi:MAG: hypothetical protein ACR2OB_11565 [Solirubrobacteraceae bacterium]
MRRPNFQFVRTAEFKAATAGEGRRPPIPRRWLALAVLVALALGVGAWVIGQQVGASPKAAHVSKRPASTPPPGLLAFHDPAGAFQGTYPAGWQRLSSADRAVVLLAASNNGASVLVRKTQIGTAVNASNLAAAKSLTDRVVKGGNKVSLLRPVQQITLGGLPGYLYLYTFQDPGTGGPGAHAHYFLFQGTTMITLVFQALPATSISSFAPLFDRVASTFRALRPAA